MLGLLAQLQKFFGIKPMITIPRQDLYSSLPRHTGITVVQTPRQTEEDQRKKRILLESMKSREVKVSFHVTTMGLDDTVSIYLSPELMSKLSELIRE